MKAAASSESFAMLRSRSTVSAWVAKTCWRRSPMRSISLRRKASGRRSSNVPHLGALEVRRGARQPEGERPLLERRAHHAALARDRAHEHADLRGEHLAAEHEPLDLGGHGL